MKITSPSFRDEEHIPRRYTRDGEDHSPPLHIEDVPTNAASLVLIMDDPDAPGGTFTHWIVFNLPPKTIDIRENHVPAPARQGTNDWGQTEYGGPKPPAGEHRYFFRLYALDVELDLAYGCSRRDVEEAMEDHIVDTAELMGRYAAAGREARAVR